MKQTLLNLLSRIPDDRHSRKSIIEDLKVDLTGCKTVQEKIAAMQQVIAACQKLTYADPLVGNKDRVSFIQEYSL